MLGDVKSSLGLYRKEGINNISVHTLRCNIIVFFQSLALVWTYAVMSFKSVWGTCLCRTLLLDGCVHLFIWYVHTCTFTCMYIYMHINVHAHNIIIIVNVHVFFAV